MADFQYFVVFAEMRTGSNFLETNLNSFDGVSCLGETFNPHFIGYPKSDTVLGVTQAQRDSNPHLLVDTIKAERGLNGFRYFNDHDPRILERILEDEDCAKVILTRNPVESYVSWKIAAETGQWKLTNVKHAKSGKIRFKSKEFVDYLQTLQNFQLRVQSALQTLGQTAFYVSYEDLQSVEVMNGLAKFLGSDSQIETLDTGLKKQNPAALSSKVENFEELEKTLASLDRFDLHRTPNFEPRRGPMVPRYVAASKAQLLYLPIKSGPETAVKGWMANLEGCQPDELHSDFNQKSLRQWMRARAGFRSFTVLRHPVARAHYAFCRHFLRTGSENFSEIRKVLKQVHGLDLPNRNLDPENDKTYNMAAHKTAFTGFLKFVKANLNLQTSIRVDPAWASQTTLLQGFAEFSSPDFVLREETLAHDLGQMNDAEPPSFSEPTDEFVKWLDQIYDADVEKAARDTYPRDYLLLGYGDWRA